MNTAKLITFVFCFFSLTGLAQPVSVVIDKGWFFRQQDNLQWMEASVPGNVHADLMQHRLIPDPFYRLNEDSVRWVEDKNWVYKTTFTAKEEVLNKQNIKIRFEGLDTYATVVLNGKTVLQADNMFRAWEVDVKDILTKNNELEITFESASGKMIPVRDALPYKLPSMNDKQTTCPLTRKAPYHYGWDWGPRLVTCGVWRPVKIIAFDDVRILNIHCQTKSADAKEARLLLSAEVASDAERNVAVNYVLHSGGMQHKGTANLTLQKGKKQYVLPEINIANPRLWYPAGYGPQDYYTLNLQLQAAQKILDNQTVITGISSIKLVQEADSIGRGFYFEVNGIPVFAKGANWIPADNLLNRVTGEVYDYLLQSAVDANMNMIRVWGGGIYEEDLFYELCVKKGLLVWQDFMFGNEMYHVDEDFLESVKQEAVYNIKRLRNYPNIALWCGDNEQEWGWIQWGWNKRFDARLMHGYRKINRQLLPGLVVALDSNRTYWRSSPTSNDEAPANDPNYGDMHFWDVHFGPPPYEKFLSVKPRFCSEFGQQSFPDWKTILQFTAPEDRSTEFDTSGYGHLMVSDVLRMHNKQPWGNKRIKDYMEYYYQVPDNLYDYAYVSQLSQAEGIKTAVEHYRRSKPVTMGALYWQINDCYPVTSWSSIDYYGRWKALHYFARKFYAPVLVSAVQQGDTLKVYQVSDRPYAIAGTLEVSVQDFAGKILDIQKQVLAVQPNSSASTVSFSMPEINSLPGFDSTGCFMHITFNDSVGNRLSSNVHYFAKVKNLNLPRPDIKIKTTKDKAGKTVYTLSSNSLAKNVFVWFEHQDGVFSDNYFDLLPGKPVSITFEGRNHETHHKSAKERLLVRYYSNADR